MYRILQSQNWLFELIRTFFGLKMVHMKVIHTESWGEKFENFPQIVRFFTHVFHRLSALPKNQSKKSGQSVENCCIFQQASQNPQKSHFWRLITENIERISKIDFRFVFRFVMKNLLQKFSFDWFTIGREKRGSQALTTPLNLWKCTLNTYRPDLIF